MGLGKTAQAIKAAKTPTLIIASKGLRFWWYDEILKWMPNLPEEEIVIIENDADPQSILKYPAEFYIMHWDLLQREPNKKGEKKRPPTERRWSAWVRALMFKDFGTIIADEAHKAKNRKAQRTQALWQLCRKPDNVYLLTGSPIINKPDDLWALLKTLYPKIYTSYWRFFEEYVLANKNPWGGYEVLGVKHRDQLLVELSTLAIRRTKKTVLPELPAKVYTVIPVGLYPKQKKAYDEIRDLMLTTIDDNVVIRAPTVLSQITRLRQVAVGLGAFEDPETTKSAKLDVLCDYLEDREGKVVIATSFVWAAKEVARRLAKQGREVGLLIGEVDDAKRVMVVKRLQEESLDTLVMTIQTGGEGWTLTAADMLIFLDRPWSPQVIKQAEDRLHRIGQSKSVQIVSLIAQGTIEEAVEEALAQKQIVFETVFGKFKELL